MVNCTEVQDLTGKKKKKKKSCKSDLEMFSPWSLKQSSEKVQRRSSAITGVFDKSGTQAERRQASRVSWAPLQRAPGAPRSPRPPANRAPAPSQAHHAVLSKGWHDRSIFRMRKLRLRERKTRPRSTQSGWFQRWRFIPPSPWPLQRGLGQAATLL